jgi:hypothetical protein
VSIHVKLQDRSRRIPALNVVTARSGSAVPATGVLLQMILIIRETFLCLIDEIYHRYDFFFEKPKGYELSTYGSIAHK